MNYAAVVRVLSILGLTLVAAMSMGAVVAIAFREWVQLAAFGIGMLGVGVVASSVLLLTPKPTRRTSPRDGLAVAVLWWILAGIAGAIPFLFDTPQGEVLAAIHESFSSFTTSGHPVLDMPMHGGEWPVSLIVWRGVLHILGALTSLVVAATVFAALNLGGPGIHKTILFTIPDRSFFDSLGRVIGASAIALSLFIVLGMLMLLATGIGASTALGDAVSVATTGLVDPGRAFEAPGNRFHAALLALGLVFSTIGLAVALEVAANRWRKVATDPEVLALIAVVLLVTSGLVIAGFGLRDSFGVVISMQSTSGLPLSDPSLLETIPIAVAGIPALIGGAALSTAGGIKLARIALLTARAGEEFSRLGFRDSVVAMRYRGRVLPDVAIVAIWVYLVAYVSALGLFIFLLTATGVPLDDALPGAIGVLSNCGSLVNLSAVDHGQVTHLIASVALILGRLEIIALLPALSPGFWRA